MHEVKKSSVALNYETLFATPSSLPAARRSVLGAEFFGSQRVAQYSQKIPSSAPCGRSQIEFRNLKQ